MSDSGADDAAPWAEFASPDAFPHDPSAAAGVEWIQTHISHVYRTADLVYKFRKPVDLGFVRFASRVERNADCLREVALNRRLAADVYLGVAALCGTAARPQVGAVAESLTGDPAREHCVVMRRLPEGRDALSLLGRGELTAAKLDAFAMRIARFHASHALGAPAPFSREAWIERCTAPAEENLRSLASGGAVVPTGRLAVARERAHAFVAAHTDRFERRRRAGRAVDGHGDLHLQHVWYERDDADPIAIDCLEFSESLRRIDGASDVAFLAMDLRYRGADDLAERFLRTYARETDDFDLYSVVDYFIAYRAGVRAKVAALAARDGAVPPDQRARAAESANRHLTLAGDALAPREKATLVLVGGAVGTGKSTVAAGLAELLHGVVISSDRVRKRLLGFAPTDRLGSAWGEGAYTREQTERTYAGLLERAAPVLSSGRIAILDATYSRRADRAAAERWARELGCETFAVEVRCASEVSVQRLARRVAQGSDPSDAGPEIHDESVRSFEELSEWPEERKRALYTDSADWRKDLPAIAARVRSRAR